MLSSFGGASGAADFVLPDRSGFIAPLLSEAVLWDETFEIDSSVIGKISAATAIDF